jgi:hypothetical protein
VQVCPADAARPDADEKVAACGLLHRPFCGAQWMPRACELHHRHTFGKRRHECLDIGHDAPSLGELRKRAVKALHCFGVRRLMM